MNTFLILIYFSMFLLVSALFFLLWWAVSKRRKFESRLEYISTEGKILQEESALILKSNELSQIPLLDRLLKKTEIAYNLRKFLETSNLSLKVGQFILVILFLGIMGFLTTYWTKNLILIVSSTFLFGVSPIFIVNHIGKKRIKMFEKQFPDALDMMKSAIKAGLGLHRAIQLVGDESPDPLGVEFRITSEKINFGIPWRDALKNLNNRVASTDVSLFVTALIIQRESGGNLNEILNKLSNIIRERFKLKGQIKVITAQGRLSQIVLVSLPFVFAGFTWTFNPDYIRILFNTSIGQKLLAVVIFLMLMGNFVIYRIIKIKL